VSIKTTRKHCDDKVRFLFYRSYHKLGGTDAQIITSLGLNIKRILCRVPAIPTRYLMANDIYDVEVEIRESVVCGSRAG